MKTLDLHYRPTPQDVGDIPLDDELKDLSEVLAEDVHEVWSQARLAEGWHYGEQRDDIRKLHPGLVPYQALTEEEKAYDRRTAIHTLRLVEKLGFMILPKASFTCKNCGAEVAKRMNYCPYCGKSLA